jgi:hypothetical protein
MNRNFVTLALATAALAFGSGSASADPNTCTRIQDFLGNPAGCNSGEECIIDVGTTVTLTSGADYCIPPTFVRGTLVIEPGVIVRGQPRYAPVVGGVKRGTPGVIIVTRGGEIDADGVSSGTSIILTTAAVDNDSDGVADDLDGNGFDDQWPGFTAPCTSGVGPNAPEGLDNILGTPDDDLGTCVVDATPDFLDDVPASAPLAPLDGNGNANVAKWGGVVLLGRAPMNTLGTTTTSGAIGQFVVEGLPVPGYPETDATCGGNQPHDSSGAMRYVSIRHAGDEIGAANELNGVTLCAQGDGTVFEFNEVYANFDDGFEWFGGTHNSNHLAVTFIGDDSVDLDQGHTGVHQFILSMSTFFNELDGTNYGSASGDKAGEWDGDDCIGDCNIAGDTTTTTTGNAGFAPLPLSSAFVYNYTVMGNSLSDLDAGGAAVSADYDPNAVLCDGDPNTVTPGEPGCCNFLPGPVEACTAANNEGIEMRAGFAGELRNSYLVNTGAEEGLDIAGGGAPGFTTPDNICTPEALVKVVTSTFDDVAALSGPGNCLAAAGGDDTEALANGDAVSLGVSATDAFNSNIYNDVITRTGAAAPGGGARGLANEDLSFDPTGDASGKLAASLKSAVINPRPAGVVGFNGAISTVGHPVDDPTALFRGAFPSSGALWTTGWTVLSIGGLLAP